MSNAAHSALVLGAATLAAAALGAASCATKTPPGRASEHERLDRVGCEALLPATKAAALVGHGVRWQETRARQARFQIVSCVHETKRAAEVLAFDVACGGGAHERFVSVLRSAEKAIRQTEPKVGDEAWASPNVYLSWHARAGCYTTVLLSWKTPRDDWLRALAGALAAWLGAASDKPAAPKP